MPRKNSLAICLFSLIASASAAPLPLDVMPAPSEVRATGERLSAGSILDISAAKTNHRLDMAFMRARGRWQARMARATGDSGKTTKLAVECAAFSPDIPTPTEDESYTLDVGLKGSVLKAHTDIGVLRGMETFLQLLSVEGPVASLPVVTIHDQPRFPWRGLMIDVARRWQPMGVIERNLDAMAVVKLNVLHLHLTEDQGFRVESFTHPELQAQGSDGKYFTQAQIKSLITYAADRGIRVVPEFDIPGHATSWVVSHPEIASLPGPYSVERQWGVFNPVLDPTNEKTYKLLADFLGEMAALFPDPFMHIGGDENNGVQWSSNARIQAYIKDHGLAGNPGLHAMFNQRIDEILRKNGKRLIGWDEILNPNLPKDCVIDSWRGTEALGQTATAGLDCILSNGFYIDLCYSAADHYATEPIPADSSLTPEQRSHVLGGEATMWAEWVSPETIDSRIWPRTAAVAERLWSPREIRDVPEMYRRLDIVSDRLTEAGSLHDRNREVMLRHLVGRNLNIEGINSLEAVIGLLEPVKHYRRGGIQIWSNQLVPLVGLADAAHPDSEPCRQLADEVDAMLFGSATIDKGVARQVNMSVDSWRAAAKGIDKMADTYPAVREAILPAHAIISACTVASNAAASLIFAKPLDQATLEASLATLDQAGAKNESATEFPALKAMRLLVVAAAKQQSRGTMDPAAWRALIQSTAFPAGSPANEAP
ncbi:MAG TPA: family 20 glycosylhydrolase [Opitutaceae bacterium]|jgi:hexosaminidase|nr:family 20 glycosylhydrolase [Opitutaceae bacterium]